MNFTPAWLLPPLSILLLWAFYGNFELSWRMANKIAALAGLFIISLTFIIGPLSKFFPLYFGKYKAHRKFLGIAGFVLVALHAILSIIFYYNLDIAYMVSLENPKVLGFYSALIAFLIFLLMTLTSTAEAVRKLGYPLWKSVQMTGYLALALSLLHFFILETTPDGIFKVRTLGMLIFYFTLLALVLRIAVFLLSLPPRKKYEEHISETAAAASQPSSPPSKPDARP